MRSREQRKTRKSAAGNNNKLDGYIQGTERNWMIKSRKKQGNMWLVPGDRK